MLVPPHLELPGGLAIGMNSNSELTSSGILVIVVDDDAAVRDSLKFSLETEGFSVDVYSGAAQLLDRMEFPNDLCLVIDQAMPDISGMDLIDELRLRRISAPAILITSHPSHALRHRAVRGGIPIVEKPLLSSALVDIIRETMMRAPLSRR